MYTVFIIIITIQGHLAASRFPMPTLHFSSIHLYLLLALLVHAVFDYTNLQCHLATPYTVYLSLVRPSKHDFLYKPVIIHSAHLIEQTKLPSHYHLNDILCNTQSLCCFCVTLSILLISSTLL